MHEYLLMINSFESHTFIKKKQDNNVRTLREKGGCNVNVIKSVVFD